MKKLTKIKLINWHLYNDASIEVKNNIVICGDNGSGKSTLIDAIHYVISAGTCKFNTAANERNDRTIESYVRGKLGFENKNCLRNSDVVSHVALEFFDDLTNSYSVVGSVIYASIGSKVEKHFYHIMNSFIVDENYYKEKDGKKVPVNLTELSNNYRIKNSKEINEFQGNQEKIRNDLLNSLGLVRQDAKTYLELLPKALAFKPIGNINSFVFDYLLPQKTLDLETMKVSVRKYRDIRQIIENEKQKLSLLEPLYDEGLVFESLDTELKLLNTLYSDREYEKLEHKKENLIKENESISVSLKTLESNKVAAEEKRETLAKEIFNLENSETNRAIFDLKNKRDSILQSIKNLQEEKDSVQNNLEDISLLLSKYDISNALKAYFYKEKYLDYKKEISIVNESLEERIDEATEELSIYKNDYKVEYQNFEKLQSRKSILDKGLKNYDENIVNLKTAIEDHFIKKFNTEIEVKIFSDLVEVKDEEWRNALEGFLNTRRFYLFVDEKYYDEALRVYDRVAKEDKIRVYGVGLVNVKALKNVDEDNINENSLFSKLSYVREDARKYAYYILNEVQTVSSVDELKNYETSITKEGMLYQAKVARFINPKFYKTPYLGRESIKIQFELVSNLLDESGNKLSSLNSSIRECDSLRISLKTIKDKISRIDLKYDVFAGIFEKNKELDRVSFELEKLSTNDLVEQEKILEKKKNEYKEISSFMLENDNKTTDLKAAFKVNSDELNEIEIKISANEEVIRNTSLNQKYLTFKEKYKNVKTIEIKKEIDETEINLKSKENTLLTLMRRYVSKEENRCDLKVEIANLSKFLSLYNEIKDRNLVEFEGKAKEAQKQCDEAFKNDYITKIRGNITEQMDNVRKLNNILKDESNRFGKDKEIYEFVIEGTKDEALKPYYDLFISDEDYDPSNLFSTELSNKNRDLMEALFKKITVDNDKETEKELEKFIDYRNFMNYDIKITDKNGNVSFYSKGGKGKSGGETQTPFYVFIAASFNQICQKNKFNKVSSPVCLMFLDEAFNNMDESRIETMMNFYSKLSIQLIISVPTQRSATILNHADTALGICKQNNNAFIIKIERN